MSQANFSPEETAWGHPFNPLDDVLAQEQAKALAAVGQLYSNLRKMQEALPNQQIEPSIVKIAKTLPDEQMIATTTVKLTVTS